MLLPVYLNKFHCIFLFNFRDATAEAQAMQPEKIIALRIVEHYRKIFDYLDYKPVDVILNHEELSLAYREFGWPKADPNVSDPIEFAKLQITRYDKQNKGAINFVEFTRLMEDLWNSSDSVQEQKCNVGFMKAKDVFGKLFDWLDRDKNGLIAPEDMLYGISRIMIRDADLNEIKNVYAAYGSGENRLKLTKDNFLLAVVNGLLDKTFKDAAFKDTFIK
jgi:Ca2+-binding EF-hand superfamily protein